jgi:carbonic anhydrase
MDALHLQPPTPDRILLMLPCLAFQDAGDKNTTKPTSIVSSTAPVNGSVKATPAQFHFHSHSEHVLAGAEYALEMRIVHFVREDQLPACGDKGCPVVLGVMLALANNESKVSPELRKIFNAMPLNEGDNSTIQGTINVDALLPSNRTYVTYEGSPTAPPCTRGLLLVQCVWRGA